MRINSIELKGYTRFRLGPIHYFKMDCVEKAQWILGTNGCGKSSLISELSPLPGHKSNFHKGGFKRVELSNNGHHYVLISDFSNGDKHTFIEDDKVLNDAGTITVQRQLVMEILGITQEIHDLLTGVEKFTKMSGPRKREWFIMLGEADYNYAISVYNKLREKLRDTQGAIKKNKERLVVETNKIISEEEATALQAEVNELHRVLNILFENRMPLIKSPEEYDKAISEIEAEILAYAQKATQLKVKAPAQFTGSNLSDLTCIIWEINNAIKQRDETISEKVKEYSELERHREMFIRSGGEGIKELQARIAPLNEQRINLRKNQQIGVVFNNPQEIIGLIDAVQPFFFEILADFPVNTDRHYSQKRLAELRTQLSAAQEKMTTLTEKLAKYNAAKQHMEGHKSEGKTECPKCRHTWIRGFDEVEFQRVCEAIKTWDAEREAALKEKEKLEAEIESVLEYGRKYRDIVRMIDNTNAMREFWEAINVEMMLIDRPREIIMSLNLFKNDLQLEMDIQAIGKQIEEINELGAAFEKSNATSLEEVSTKLEALNTSITQLTQQQNKDKLYHQALVEFSNGIMALTNIGQQLTTLRDQYDQTVKQAVEANRIAAINDMIQQFHSILAVKDKALNEVSTQKRIVEEIKNNLEVLALEEEAYKTLVTQLSPTDGLIAEGVFGFIRVATNQMNHFIHRSWSYPMEVLPCGMSGENGVELDYRFQLKLFDETNPVPDVAKGSTGQQEIVDLAFKIMAMNHLGMGNYPLFLDEFGSNLDNVHRTNVGHAIKAIMEQQAFSQLFMISHSFVEYASIPNVDICVLHPDNIVVPDRYNEHVIIE